MKVGWQPHEGPQREFCSRGEFEVLYGGAAGPGKTECLIMEALRYVHKPKYNGLILRRNFPQLEEIIDRTREYYPLLGGVYKTGEHRWYFPSGAKVKMGHIQNDGDEYNYQGKEYQYIGFDEAAQFSKKQYLYLFSRCRSTDPTIPKRIRAASNPGGPGHAFIKDRFKIGLIPPGTTIHDEIRNTTRVFIPGKLTDNPSLLENDPEYVNRLMELPEIERMRLMEGIWDAFEGQALPELNREVHGIDKFDIPPEWPRYRGYDHGYSTPFAVLWFAVDYEGRIFVYDEWYGTKGGDNLNEGQRMTAVEIARGIKEREKEMRGKVMPGPADPDIWNPRWKVMGKKNYGIIGDSPAIDMQNEGVMFLRADNDRILGRQQVHKRLELDEKNNPQIYIMNHLEHTWRTLPLLREFEKNPEDIESKNVEDHLYSVIRYFCMFKPVKAIGKVREDAGSFQAERRKYIRAKQLASRTGMSMAQAYGSVR